MLNAIFNAQNFFNCKWLVLKQIINMQKLNVFVPNEKCSFSPSGWLSAKESQLKKQVSPNNSLFISPPPHKISVTWRWPIFFPFGVLGQGIIDKNERKYLLY